MLKRYLNPKKFDREHNPLHATTTLSDVPSRYRILSSHNTEKTMIYWSS